MHVTFAMRCQGLVWGWVGSGTGPGPRAERVITHSPLTPQVATPPMQSATATGAMEVDSATVVMHPGDLGVDTSNIYHNKTDDSVGKELMLYA